MALQRGAIFASATWLGTRTANSSPAEPGGHEARAHARGEPGAEAAQQFIARLMAERVVHLLEAVQIDEEDGAHAAHLQHGGEAPAKQVPIGQRGQAVMGRLMLPRGLQASKPERGASLLPQRIIGRHRGQEERDQKGLHHILAHVMAVGREQGERPHSMRGHAGGGNAGQQNAGQHPCRTCPEGRQDQRRIEQQKQRAARPGKGEQAERQCPPHQQPSLQGGRVTKRARLAAFDDERMAGVPSDRPSASQSVHWNQFCSGSPP